MILGKNFWKGYLRICFWGQESERFLNLCAHHKDKFVRLKNTRRLLGLCIDFRFLSDGEVRRKTGTKIK